MGEGEMRVTLSSFVTPAPETQATRTPPSQMGKRIGLRLYGHIISRDKKWVAACHLVGVCRFRPKTLVPKTPPFSRAWEHWRLVCPKMTRARPQKELFLRRQRTNLFNAYRRQLLTVPVQQKG